MVGYNPCQNLPTPIVYRKCYRAYLRIFLWTNKSVLLLIIDVFGCVVMAKALTKLQLLEIMARVPLFKTLSAVERERVLTDGAAFESISADNPFIVEGSHGPSFYIILSGQAVVRRHGHKVATMTAGQFIGEVGFICNEVRTASVVALTDMLVLKIDRDNFQRLPSKIRESIKDKVISGLVARVGRQTKQIISLQHAQLLEEIIA